MRQRLATLVAVAAMLASMTLVTGVALAANQAANLDQCANDPAPSAPIDGCNANASQWVNGNLGASKSIYREGDSIAYRMRFTNIVTGSPIHNVIIEWDTTKQGKHAIDYLTTWNRTVANANPCLGVSGCVLGSPSDTEPIPVDPQVSGGGVTQVPGVFTMWGGTITGLSAYSYPDGAGFAGDKTARIQINFRATVANPVLAWGGHIATRQDWGADQSAVAISGSPYHMRLIDLDGAGGNQDRSLSADAVIFPGKITVVKHADTPSSTVFTFNGTDFSPNPFTLVDNSAATDPSKDSNQILTFGNKTVSEVDPLPGYKLDSIACTSDQTNNYTPTINAGGAGGSVSIGLTEGENVTCTFNNLAQNAAMTIDKTVTSVGADTSAPFDAVTTAGTAIGYSVLVTNTGNVTLTGVSVSDPLIANLDCNPNVAGNQTTGFTLAPQATLTCTGSYTVQQSDLNDNGGGDGDIDNTATADSDQTTPIQDSEMVPLAPNAAISITKTVAAVGADAEAPFDPVEDANTVVTYSIVVTNTGNVTLTGVFVTDPRLADLDCDGTPGTPRVTTGFQLAPGGTLTCGGTYTITQADLDDDGGGDGDIDNTATADSNQTGSVESSAEVDLAPTSTLSISKTVTEVDGDEDAPFVVDEAGDVISYEIVVTNTGNTTLTGVTVSDSIADDLDCDPADGNQTGPFTLAPGASRTCTATYTVTQDDLDAGGNFDTSQPADDQFDVIHNVATADSDQTGPETADADVPVDQKPNATIDKVVLSVDGDTQATFLVDEADDVISYRITYTNTGNVTLTGVTVSDPLLGTLTCTIGGNAASSPFELAPGQAVVCTGSYTVTQADIDNDGGGDEDIDNTATGDSNETSPINDSEAVPLDRSPNATIDKVVTAIENADGTDGGDAADAAGDVIRYQITYTNTGNTTLTGVTVSDPLLGTLSCTIDAAPATSPFTLAPGEAVVCTGSYTVTQDDLDDDGGGDGDIDNTATGDSNQTDPTQDSEDVPVEPAPALEILKTADQSTFDAVGDVITYTITVENTGNTTLLNVTVTDPKVDNIDCDGVAGEPYNPTIASIAVGSAPVTCTASHTITQADLDAGSYLNTACADDGEGGAEEDCDDASTTAEQDPELTVVKSDNLNPQKYENVGDVITFTIVATNTGNVTLHNVTVYDVPVLDDFSCDPVIPVADLAPGAAITCTGTHTITQADLDAGEFLDTACADDGEGGAAEACDENTVEGKNQPTINTSDYLIPQDSVTLAGLTDGATGDLYIELRINETCGQDNTPAWSYTWADAQNGTYNTEDLTGGDAQTVTVSTDAVIRWCTSYSGDADNAARPLSDRDEVVQVDFDPLLAGFVGFAIPTLAWGLWTMRKRREEERAA